jgi:hypothetical protein
MSNSNELSGSHAGGQMNEEAIDASAVNDIVMAGDKSKGERPYFFNSAETERVMNIAMAIAAELAVVRERIDTIERLLEAKGILQQSEIEAMPPAYCVLCSRNLMPSPILKTICPCSRLPMKLMKCNKQPLG